MSTSLKKRWLNLRIATKVGLILVSLVCACLVVAGSAFIQNSRITGKLHDVVFALLPASRLSQNVVSLFTEQRRLYEDAIVTDEELLLKNAKGKAASIQSSLEELEQLLQGPVVSVTRSIPGIRQEISTYSSEATAVYGGLIENTEDPVNNKLYDQSLALAQQSIFLESRLTVLNSSIQNLLDSQLTEIREFIARQQILGVLLALLTIGLALLISFLLSRLITRPIVALATTARSITDGSWSGELIPVGNDEVAELTRSFSNMLAVLQQREEALVEGEKRYRQIFNATREAIIIYDAKTLKVLDVNRTCCELTGFEEDEILTMQFAGMGSGIAPYTQEYARKYFARTLEGKSQVFEWQIQKKDGELLMAELSLSMAEIDRGEIIIMVARDITQRKKNEAEREKLAKQLQQADKMETLGTLAGGIAHDFNNILSGIFGYTELAAMHQSAGKDVQIDLKQIKKAAIRARDLVAQILAFSRKGEQAVTIFDPATIVKEVVSLLRSSVPSTIAIEHSINSDARIKADPSQLHQVMMNLCTNAVHAMEEEGGRLGISVSEISTDDTAVHYPSDLKSGYYLCIEVSDTGIGMDSATRERIFEPYFTTKSVGKGTGLGLSVVHGIVTEYGGGLVVESVPAQGTIFRVFLPVAEPESVSVRPVAQRVLVEGGALPRGSCGRIMLIDDEPDLVNVMAAFLVQVGYQVCTYTDSIQALKDFSKTPELYAVVISDMTMPGMTGLELSQKMLALCPKLPFILLTGYSEQVSREKALEKGICEFFLKPIDLYGLLQAICSILGQDPERIQQ